MSSHHFRGRSNGAGSFFGIRISVCVMIFIAGWLAGGSFTFYFMWGDPGFSSALKVDTPNAIRYKVDERGSMKDTAVERIKYSKNIPWIIVNESAAAESSPYMIKNVFMDWPMGPLNFGYFNYKSVESVLAIYPHAKISIFMGTGIKGSANDANLLRTHFLKYNRQQFDVSAIAYESKLPKAIMSRLGTRYRSKWDHVIAAASRNNSMIGKRGAVPPFHWLFFWRLANLWLCGGVYTDLSYLLLGPLDPPVVQQGYHILSSCSNPSTSIETLPDSSFGEDQGVSEGFVAGDCVSSTMLVFNRPKSPVILCTLGKFDDVEFENCLTSDHRASGVDCVKYVLQECFKKEKVANDLAAKEIIVKQSGARQRKHVVESFSDSVTFAKYNLLSNPDWKLELGTRVLWIGALSSGMNSWYDVPFADSSLMHQAMSTLNNKFRIVQQKSSSLLLNREGKASTSSNFDAQSAHLRGFPKKQPPQCSRYFSNYELDWERKNARNYSLASRDHTSSMGNLTDQSFSGEDVVPLGHSGFEFLACAPSVIIVSFDELSATALAKALSQYPLILSSFLKDSPVLGSGYRKAVSCYSDTLGSEHHRLRTRMWCFPFVSSEEASCEDGVGLITLDDSDILIGSYRRDYNLPFALKRDNPSIKILFVIKNPVLKLMEDLQQQQQNIRSLVDTDAFVLRATEKFEKFGVLREMVQSASESFKRNNNDDLSHQAIKKYYTEQFSAEFNSTSDFTNRALGADILQSIFDDSLFAFPIAHFAFVLGAENIKVIAAEEILVTESSTSESSTEKVPFVNSSVLDSVYSFLQMCPTYDSKGALITLTAGDIESPSSLAISQPILPRKEATISADTYSKLERFFEPFNALISVIVPNFDSMVLVRHSRAISAHLLPFSPFINTTRDPMWFEAVKLERINKLVPQRTTTEDSRFNTTLGMLNTF